MINFQEKVAAQQKIAEKKTSAFCYLGLVCGIKKIIAQVIAHPTNFMPQIINCLTLLPSMLVVE